MQIRDLATASGATAQTIRFYERRGLLDPAEREGNGYRRYDDAALSRLRFIRSAQTAGLTLTEIGSIITVREAGEVPCGHVSDLLAAKLADVHRHQQELALLETELRHLIEASQSLDPNNCEAGSVCHVITQSHQ
ncbi:heavy metal-responsive transcriptional regulator [Cryobacterium zhongshanensis]|uniref:Heavy metal-responsive transcriptional regulator n=1 Tax=Cryobacterium zhongshanensis TaxID=2928153 RepID=A0AA41QVK7_9MICO|nr:heavy metal-responsive transcriptional regulator [Cryobacterium zhongshanensis]MCI4658481.1 heavy metal-responsive transcriptional regulator [Cryobacterium zhongshanensis]